MTLQAGKKLLEKNPKKERRKSTAEGTVPTKWGLIVEGEKT